MVEREFKTRCSIIIQHTIKREKGSKPSEDAFKISYPHLSPENSKANKNKS